MASGSGRRTDKDSIYRWIVLTLIQVIIAAGRPYFESLYESMGWVLPIVILLSNLVVIRFMVNSWSDVFILGLGITTTYASLSGVQRFPEAMSHIAQIIGLALKTAFSSIKGG